MALEFTGEGYSDPIGVLTTERSGTMPLERYLGGLSQRYIETRLGEAAMMLAAIVEPTDRATGKQPDAPKAKAFFSGTLIGLRILERCTPEEIVDYVTEAQLELPGLDADNHDQYEAEADQASAIIEHSHEGLNLNTEIHGLAEAWSAEYSGDYDEQVFFQRGIGTVIYAINEARTNTDINAVLNGSFDWTAALEGLTNPGTA